MFEQSPPQQSPVSRAATAGERAPQPAGNLEVSGSSSGEQRLQRRLRRQIFEYLNLFDTVGHFLLLPDQTVKCGRTCEKTRYKKGGSLVSGEDLDILGLRGRR